jgi:hypothetical protein
VFVDELVDDMLPVIVVVFVFVVELVDDMLPVVVVV